VGVADGGAAAVDGRGLQARFGLAGEIGGHGLGDSRQRVNATGRAPGLEACKVAPVGPARGRRLVLPSEKLGGDIVADKTDIREDGVVFVELAYGWRDLDALAQRASMR
jgi:hypothetical protein